MSFQTPVSKCTTAIPGLGKLDGLQYATGVQQFCGIPYARLSKRWTRSQLKTSWENEYHDGTKLGNNCPIPFVEGDDSDELVPVPPVPHFSDPPVFDELSALVMNIVIPRAFKPNDKPLPVFVYIHGGSLLYGGANLPIFDAVNLVSYSVATGLPMICVNFNYRVGLGGFLAGTAIEAELKRDGFAGSGNFGFTDQQVAFDWVQKFIGSLGGDPENVTAVGESAGSISISNQMLASTPPVFHRAACMSGLSVSIPAWTIPQHDRLFDAVCHHFKIDPIDASALDRLRAIPQQELANATPLIQGVPSGTGNPCIDGWFYPRRIRPHGASEQVLKHTEIYLPPKWLKALMIGDTYHEGVIFHHNLVEGEEDYESIRRVLLSHIKDEKHTDSLLESYHISPQLPRSKFLSRVEDMCGDAIFKIPTRNLAEDCARKGSTTVYAYHFDQRSRIKNSFEGTAYHSHELLYLFGNLENEMNSAERMMGKQLMLAWIGFTNGLEPWEPYKVARNLLQCSYLPSTIDEKKMRNWMVWGPDSRSGLENEFKDGRFRRRGPLRIHEGVLAGVDCLVTRRWKLFGCLD